MLPRISEPPRERRLSAHRKETVVELFFSPRVAIPAIHAGRDVGVKPRLIVLDLSMPRMDGLETLRRLREDEQTRLLPVVMLTASNHSAVQAEAYRLGVNGYVDKLSEVPYPEMVKRIADYWLGLNELAPT